MLTCAAAGAAKKANNNKNAAYNTGFFIFEKALNISKSLRAKAPADMADTRGSWVFIFMMGLIAMASAKNCLI
jgi:hypothetical protein